MHLHMYGPNTVLELAFPFYVKNSSGNTKFFVVGSFLPNVTPRVPVLLHPTQHHAHHHGFFSALQTWALEPTSSQHRGQSVPFTPWQLNLLLVVRWERQTHGVTDRFGNGGPRLHHSAPPAPAEIICHMPRGARWAALACNSPQNGSRNTHAC